MQPLQPRIPKREWVGRQWQPARDLIDAEGVKYVVLSPDGPDSDLYQDIVFDWYGSALHVPNPNVYHVVLVLAPHGIDFPDDASIRTVRRNGVSVRVEFAFYDFRLGRAVGRAVLRVVA